MELLIIGLLIAVLGVVIFIYYREATNSKKSIALVYSSQATLEERAKYVNELLEENKLLKSEIEKKSELVSALSIEKAQIEEQKKAFQEKIKEYQTFTDKAQAELKMQFENIANEQLQRNAKLFSESSTEKLDNLIKPLSENINNFKSLVTDTYSKETQERASLKGEISKIIEQNSKINTTSENLANALKGDRKLQGGWGEVVLERFFEDAGLKKDIHYKAQEMMLDEGGARQLPDYKIYLPEGKHIIVDSKVSLVSYERYFAEQDAQEREKHGRSFIDSIKSHIRGLSGKNYQDNEKVNTLDFVIMFMPIEGTFQLANQYSKDIFSFAWNSKVVIAGPSTLLPILRTISYLWKVDAQNKNTQSIIRNATLLYDKFVNFVSSMERIGKHISSTEEAYKDAISQLKDGKGNAISLVKKLEEYGIEKKGNKKLPDLMRDDLAEDEKLLEETDSN